LALLNEETAELRNLKQQDQEIAAKYFFDKLTKLYRLALLYFYKDDESEVWLKPSIAYLKNLYFFNKDRKQLFFDRGTVENMIAWDF